MTQRSVMTSRCDVMPSYEIEAILVCFQFSHANWPVSHTYCSIVVYYQAKISETRYTSAKQYVKPYEKKHGNKRAEPSRDSPLTFKHHFFDVPTKSELTRPSADCQTTVFRGIKQLEEFLKKVAERSRDSGWGHATVGRLSNNVFECFKQLENFLKKVTERSRDSGRRSRDHRPTVKLRVFDFSSK